MSFPNDADTFPTQPFLAVLTLASAQHSKLHADLGYAITTIEQWAAPTINAKALGCKGDDVANDAAVAQFVMQLAVNIGVEAKFPAGTYRCDDGTTATRITVSYASANGHTRIFGDGEGNTVFKSHVPLGTPNVALVDFTNTDSGHAPVVEGITVQGPGVYVNPNTEMQTGTTSGTGTQITSMTGVSATADVGRTVAGTGIPAGAYIRKIVGTTVTISAALTGAGGAGTTITVGTGSPSVGCGLRIACSGHYIQCGGWGWYAGFLSTGPGANDKLDHFYIEGSTTQENVAGHYIADTTGAADDYMWQNYRCSRNALTGVLVGDKAFIGTATMIDVHFNAQPYAIMKEGVDGTTPTVASFIQSLEMVRVKFEGSGNRPIHDPSGLAVINGLNGYVEVHGIEINGQQKPTTLTTYSSNDHTLRPTKITTMSRDGAGLVTATVSPALAATDVGGHIAVAGVLVNGTGDTTNGSPSVTNCVGISAADVGRRIFGTGIPVDTIIGAFSGTTITLKDFAGANVNATSTGTGRALAASAYHGAFVIKTVSGATVTWESAIQATFGAEAGSLGTLGFMRCGSFISSDLRVDFQSDASSTHTYPERHFNLLDASDVTIRPQQPEAVPVNFPSMHLRTVSATYTARKANVVCVQGSIRAWLGKCAAAVSAGFVVKPGVGGINLAHHDGVKTTTVGGVALQAGDTTTSASGYTATRPWIWVQDQGFVDQAAHGPGLAATSGQAEKWMVVDTANVGKTIAWDGTTAGKVVVAISLSAQASGVVAAKLVSPFLTV